MAQGSFCQFSSKISFTPWQSHTSWSSCDTYRLWYWRKFSHILFFLEPFPKEFWVKFPSCVKYGLGKCDTVLIEEVLQRYRGDHMGTTRRSLVDHYLIPTSAIANILGATCISDAVFLYQFHCQYYCVLSHYDSGLVLSNNVLLSTWYWAITYCSVPDTES